MKRPSSIALATPTILLPIILTIILAAACAPVPVAERPGQGAAPSATTSGGPEQGSGAAVPAAGKQPLSGLEFPVVTRHESRFNDKPLPYTATVGAIEVNDVEGKPGARVVSIAYVAETGPYAAGRPVMFVFNGGPISPSVYLHMGAFGPKRVAFADDLSADVATAPLVDNPHSLLDVTDLVFFDPAGTGFSRTLPGKPLEDYFSVSADAQQTASFIASWLDQHGRRASPVYIFGESYGTNRAVETARQLAELPQPVLLDGVVLFGQAVNIIEYAQRPDNIISYAVSLPTLAALGWYHGKAETGGADLERFVASAWEYARTEYLQALFQGAALPEDRLREVARRLAGFSGLPAELFVARRLRVSKEDYRVELFREEGLVIGRSDGRYVGPAKAEGDGEGASPPDPAAALPRALAAAFLAYAVAELGVPSTEQYVIDSPVRGLDGWDWGERTPFSRFAYGDSLDVLLDKNPRARVLVTAGYFDTMTTTGASLYLVNQESWPAERVTLAFYRGGHMAYSIDDSARKMADDLRAWISPP
jgi:carboxypeptidase C (cathepsin A)